MEKENQDYITNPFSEKKRSNFKKKIKILSFGTSKPHLEQLMKISKCHYHLGNELITNVKTILLVQVVKELKSLEVMKTLTLDKH